MIQFDASNFLGNLAKIAGGAPAVSLQATRDMADTLMLESTKLVPFDKSGLLKSGHVVPEADGTSVVYSIEYAAYQHEGGDGKRKIRNYGNGRQGHYLSDPLTNNISRWREIAQDRMNKFLS